MDVVVNARHCEISDRFREHVQEKLSRLEKHDHRVIRVEAEVEVERNPRLQDRAVRVHRGRRTPVSVAQALADVGQGLNGDGADATEDAGERQVGPLTVTGEGPLVVREKTHTATPMSLAQALYEMELVGHDFFLFVDEDTHHPSVVYRRKGYDYGVISLDVA
jgi:ribosomal subunit interface protein